MEDLTAYGDFILEDSLVSLLWQKDSFLKATIMLL